MVSSGRVLGKSWRWPMNEVEKLRREKLWLAVIMLFIVGTFTWAVCPARGQQSFPKVQMAQPLPPVEYDHWYEGDLTIRIVNSVEHLALACKWSEVRPKSLACASVRPNSCTIYLLQDEVSRELGWDHNVVLRHEMGHCNGWPADHPGRRGLKQ